MEFHPSHAAATASARHYGLRSAIAPWSAERSVRSPHPRQTTASSRPCRSMTARLPGPLVQPVHVVDD